MKLRIKMADETAWPLVRTKARAAIMISSMNVPKKDIHGGDNELWHQFREGDRQAMAILFKRYYSFLYDYLLKLSGDAESAKDTIQEAFLYLWRKRETLSSADSVRAYLLATVRRTYLRANAESQKRHHRHQSFLEPGSTAFSPEELIVMREEAREKQKALERALNEIPPRLREAIYLKTHNNLTYKEIASIMSITPQVARNYVSEALSRLRRIFL